MNERDFRNLVREMMDAQQRYFRQGRKQSDLIHSKELEKKVRRELDAGPDVPSPSEPEQIPLDRFGQFE